MSTDIQYTNGEFYAVIAEAEQKVAESGGAVQVFQKFTCGGCGRRLTMDVPNSFYKEGSCDNCHHITNIEQAGCNYLLIAVAVGGQSETLSG